MYLITPQQALAVLYEARDRAYSHAVAIHAKWGIGDAHREQAVRRLSELDREIGRWLPR